MNFKFTCFNSLKISEPFFKEFSLKGNLKMYVLIELKNLGNLNLIRCYLSFSTQIYKNLIFMNEQF